MSGSGRETLPDLREWSGGPPRFAGVVGRPSRTSGSGRDAARIFWSCRKTTRISGRGREAHPDVWEWPGDPPKCPGVIGRPSRMSGSGREALLDIRSDKEAIPDVREW